MSGHTRKHRISNSPFVSEEDFSEEKSTPWREVFREGIEKFSEVGLMLKGGRHKAGLTQKALADKIGVKPHHISEMEHGKRPIGKNIAHRLAEIFNVDYRVFL
jgi:ribosome-binding protein aMBF1 (putative translation factor)